MNNELILVLIGAITVTLHTIWKCNRLLKKAQVANIDFSWKKDFLYKDYLGIIFALLAAVLMHLLFPEVLKNYPALENWARLLYATASFTFSYFLQKLFGVAEPLIDKFVDSKTNHLNKLLGEEPGTKSTL